MVAGGARTPSAAVGVRPVPELVTATYIYVYTYIYTNMNMKTNTNEDVIHVNIQR